MESIYTELALYGSKNLCAKTDTVFLPISEVYGCTVSLCQLDCKIRSAVIRAAQAAALEETLETSKTREPTSRLKAPL